MKFRKGWMKKIVINNAAQQKSPAHRHNIDQAAPNELMANSQLGSPLAWLRARK